MKNEKKQKTQTVQSKKHELIYYKHIFVYHACV
jgi:hypothetical protein